MVYRNHFYITLFSNAAQKSHPNNTLAEFTIQLAQRVDLGSKDNWEVGLCEFSCPHHKPVNANKPLEVVGETNALLYCDLITPQFVGSYNVRCLRTFIHPSKFCEHRFNNVYYVPVQKRSFQDISILIKDIKGKNINFKAGAVPTKAVLHFRRV